MGDSGASEGNEVSDLSEAAMEEAELGGCEWEASLLRERAADRWLLADVLDWVETERSRGAGGAAAVVAPMSAGQHGASPWRAPVRRLVWSAARPFSS